MPDMKKLYDLAYQFRNEKIWTKVFEEEVFAVDLPDGKTAYCNIMGRNGEHRAVSIHIGEEAFATSFWPLLDGAAYTYEDILIQDCIQCSMEKTAQLDPEELDMVRDYCKTTGKKYISPYPQFSRYKPRCVPWRVESEEDWTAIQTVLEIVHLMYETIRWKGKDALLLNPVINIPVEESDQIDMFGHPKTDHLVPELIPLYFVVDNELHIKPTKLPLRMERSYKAPDHFDNKKFSQLMKKKQTGVLECEIVQFPEPVEGTPPYIPSALLLAQEKDGMLLTPVMMKGAPYDPNKVVADLLEMMLKAGIYPKRIKVRTLETQTIMEPFCQRARIWLEKTEKLPDIDEAKMAIMSDMEEDKLDDNLGGITEMLGDLTLEQIREMPEYLVETIKKIMPVLPPEIVVKLKKAWR